jgi:uncharacterized protein YjiS (DUF1127 family)
MAISAFEHPVLADRFGGLVLRGPNLTRAAEARLAIWALRARTRAQLREMDPLRYPDLNLTTAEVLREAAKPFWRA